MKKLKDEYGQNPYLNIQNDHTLGINTILHTKDGRKIGNSIVTGKKDYFWEVTTDYGSKKFFTIREINELFYIAWADLSETEDGISCDDMQIMMAKDHKNRVNERPNKEYILCAAIWYKDLETIMYLPKNCDRGIVLSGWRHVNIIHQMFALKGLRTVTNGDNAVGEYEQGFLTSHGRFVGRRQASVIAFNAGQTKKLKGFLYSEDIY